MGTRATAILDELSTALDGASDYAVAKALGVTRSTTSNWRVGRGSLSDDVAIRAAKILKRDPSELLVLAAEDRATTDLARKAWTNLAKQLRAGAIGVIAITGISGFQQTKPTSAADPIVREVCILC